MPNLPKTYVDTATVADKAIHLLDTMIEVFTAANFPCVCIRVHASQTNPKEMALQFAAPRLVQKPTCPFLAWYLP